MSRRFLAEERRFARRVVVKRLRADHGGDLPFQTMANVDGEGLRARLAGTRAARQLPRAGPVADEGYARGWEPAGDRPWRRMISPIFARSGGPPADWLMTSADSRK